ncbi:MAG: 23S rRNA (guanosine(2251)-2'-O)-methyltransferase RlmB [Kiritimatiellaeota bacterium]|nr:23S rRNA (guanosine(2251)-2'-O)-methyltransferase RlmB [Kiritimatiellota bacterium]
MRRKTKNGARKNRHADLSVRLRVGNEEHLLERLENCSVPLVLILDGIQDPHNLGACLRTAAAAGVDAVVVPKDRAVSLTDTVRRIACGGAESVPFHQVTNLAGTLKRLKDAGIWIVGTSDHAEKSLYDVDLTCPTGIVIGGEADGVRRLTADSCDHLVSIPMLGKVPCLNASVATGVALFEVVRQRGILK